MGESERRRVTAAGRGRRRLTRRSVVGGMATALVATVAGCSGDGGSDADGDGTGTGSPPGRETRTRTETVAASPSRTETGATTGTRTTTTGATEGGGTSPEAAIELARRTLERIAAGEYEAAVEPFSTRLASSLGPRALESAWERQVWIMGGFDRLGDGSAERRDEGGYRVTLTVEGEYAPIRSRVVVVDGRVQGLFFENVTRGSYTPPEYADESGFTEREVTVDAGAGCPLGGTLTVPADRDGPVPGVVLVHGSGPNDRDGTVGPQKPLKDLAWGLATRGIAVLRYRKRTAECSASTAELTPDWIAVEDAVAATDVLGGAPEVRSDGIAVLGHSLGGYLGPMIARRANDATEAADGVAALALLAAPGRSLWRSNLYQYRQLVTMDGELSGQEQRTIDRLEQVGNRIDEQGFRAGRRVFGQAGAFWTAVTDYDQVAVAAGLPAPTLVLQGERDVQVHPEEAPAAWRDGLPTDGKSDVRTYAPANHLLIPGSGPSFVGRYYVDPGNVARDVVADLSGWIPEAVGD